jgi:hypothetical protein
VATPDIRALLTRLFSELVDGPSDRDAFILNSGDAGLMRSLDKIAAADASRSVNGGATIAAHAHLAYHLGAIRQINKDVRGPREGTCR